MGFLICAACMFTFPAPAQTDVDDVRHLIERTYGRQDRPWSEAAGPFASVKLMLLTPEFGIAKATLTSVGASIDSLGNPTWVSKREIRVSVRKDREQWTVFDPE
jgi:hypothetical protein